MNFDIGCKRTRPTIAGTHGAVAAAHPLATQAGLDMLRAGGNAVDAVVAMAATLAVVEPYMSGLGGVGFLLLHSANGESRTLNFSGNTPAAARAELFTPETQDIGPRACMIPGNVAGWFEALQTHGTKSPADVLAAGIRLAEDGYPLHPGNVLFLERGLQRLNDAGREVFGNVEQRIGAILRLPELGKSLRALADNGPDEFYHGALGARIVEYVQSQGGFLSSEDLSTYRPTWEDPIEVDYKGVTVRTCPPNNEGFQILQTLKMLEDFDLKALGHNSTEYIHLLSEAMKLAVADRIEYCGDPLFRPVPLERLLADDYIAERRRQINHERASHSEGERWRGAREQQAVSPGKMDGLTTHLAAVDNDGNVASITQSIGNGFGSGVVVPGTGILLNNFVWWTEIDPACPTPNLLEPGKRWSSCMAPLHVCRDGKFWFSIATPGSEGILQTVPQMALNIIEFAADPQLAIEAPRFRLWENTRMQIEDSVGEPVLQELTARGHELERLGEFSFFVGGGQSVMIDPTSGARLAGADPRRDGYALAY